MVSVFLYIAIVPECRIITVSKSSCSIKYIILVSACITLRKQNPGSTAYTNYNKTYIADLYKCFLVIGKITVNSGENVISHKIKDCSNKNYKYDYMKPYMVSCVISAFTCISRPLLKRLNKTSDMLIIRNRPKTIYLYTE